MSSQKPTYTVTKGDTKPTSKHSIRTELNVVGLRVHTPQVNYLTRTTCARPSNPYTYAPLWPRRETLAGHAFRPVPPLVVRKNTPANIYEYISIIIIIIFDYIIIIFDYIIINNIS